MDARVVELAADDALEVQVVLLGAIEVEGVEGQRRARRRARTPWRRGLEELRDGVVGRRRGGSGNTWVTSAQCWIWEPYVKFFIFFPVVVVSVRSLRAPDARRPGRDARAMRLASTKCSLSSRKSLRNLVTRSQTRGNRREGEREVARFL